jgi:putative ABC transport system substrate-binding protein
MRRREFLGVLGGGAGASWPLVAWAQQAVLPLIGFLHSGSSNLYARLVHAFQDGLNEAGYIEGRNIAIEYRWADGKYDRLPILAADLVLRQVAVIVANSPAIPAAKAATTTIPIIFQTGSDPVASGLVASLSRPGGNLTGVSTMNVELTPKRLELLREFVPTAIALALLVNPTNPNADIQSRDLKAAAVALGLQLHVLYASSERDFDTVFTTLAQLRVGGLVIAPDAFFISRSEQLAELTVRHALPAIFSYREFAAAGGLLSYGGSSTDQFRQAGIYAGRILKGERPADLPVQQVTKIELIINLKIAKVLGLTVPLSLLGRADEVIE